MKASDGDADAYRYATIYAQWGDTPKALAWLETALRLRDSGLENLKPIPSWTRSATSRASRR